MKISWKKYPSSSFYDEYVTPQNTLRGHSKKIGTFLESLSLEDLKEINIATETAIKLWEFHSESTPMKQKMDRIECGH